MGRGRAPCCDTSKVKKGPWSPSEDLRLISFIQKNGHDNWRALPHLAGLLRCGKSCRLRWINYLRPDVKRGNFSIQEEETIINLHNSMGNKWSKIASHFPGRTDNEIKNVWNTTLKKRLREENEALEDQGKKELMLAKRKKSHLNCSNSSSTSNASNISNLIQVENPIIKEDQEFEIPLESDIEAIWNMLDHTSDYSKSNDSCEQIECKIRHDIDSRSACRKWLKHLETELGLDEEGNGDDRENDEDRHIVSDTAISTYSMTFQSEIALNIDEF